MRILSRSSLVSVVSSQNSRSRSGISRGVLVVGDLEGYVVDVACALG